MVWYRWISLSHYLHGVLVICLYVCLCVWVSACLGRACFLLRSKFYFSRSRPEMREIVVLLGISFQLSRPRQHAAFEAAFIALFLSFLLRLNRWWRTGNKWVVTGVVVRVCAPAARWTNMYNFTWLFGPTFSCAVSRRWIGSVVLLSGHQSKPKFCKQVPRGLFDHVASVVVRALRECRVWLAGGWSRGYITVAAWGYNPLLKAAASSFCAQVKCGRVMARKEEEKMQLYQQSRHLKCLARSTW